MALFSFLEKTNCKDREGMKIWLFKVYMRMIAIKEEPEPFRIRTGCRV